jgi:hypothetical protein
MKIPPHIYRKKNIENYILYYFIFLLAFISLRVLLISGNSFSNFGELIFSMLPEIFIGFIGTMVVINVAKSPIKPKLTLYDKLIIGYIGTNIVLGILLSMQFNVIMYGIRLTYIPMMLYFIARFGITQDKYTYEQILDKLNIVFLIAAIIGLFIYFFAISIDDYMVQRSNGVVGFYFIRRMNSIIWTPVVWGTFMGFSSIYNFLKLNKKFSIKQLLIFLTVWTSLFLSISRGAFIAFSVCFILIIITQKKYKTVLITISSIALILLLLNIRDSKTIHAFNYISSSSVSTITKLFNSNSNSNLDQVIKDSNTRVSYWKMAFEDFADKPMGHGLGKAGHVARRFFKEGDKSASIHSTDGWYVKVACETGVWGFLSFAIISFIYFIQSIKYLRKNKGTIYLFFFLIFIFVGIQNIGSNVLDFYIFANLYWMLLGFSQNMINNLENGKNES